MKNKYPTVPLVLRHIAEHHNNPQSILIKDILNKLQLVPEYTLAYVCNEADNGRNNGLTQLNTILDLLLEHVKIEIEDEEF